MIKTIPKKKKGKKAKRLSEEALQIAEKRREAKGKGEKERYTHLNGKFQRIARRDKKAFLSDQCKEIEENNRMGKTRDLLKKIRDTKGTFRAKMGSIKNRIVMNLMKTKDTKKRWQEHTEKLHGIARRDKKAFLSDQCKEIEENNRMGKTRDLLKKIRDTKGTFHAKMGSIKNRIVMNLMKTKDTKKRWQEHTEKLHKKDPDDPNNHDSVITHLEPDILEGEVKWALGSITTNKASGGDGIPVELFQFINDDAEYIMRNAWRKVNNLRYANDTTLMAESEEELKSFLMKLKEESEKAGLKLQHSKN